MKMKLTQVITSMVESFLPRSSKPELGLLFAVDVSADHHTEDGKNKVKGLRYILQMLVVRPSKYTKVYFRKVAFNEGGFFDLKDEKIQWQMMSDHDSCWRSDGMCCWFEQQCRIWEYFEQHGVKRENISELISFSIFCEPTHVKISHREMIDRNDRYNGSWEIVIEDKVKLQDLHNYLPKE